MCAKVWQRLIRILSINSHFSCYVFSLLSIFIVSQPTYAQNIDVSISGSGVLKEGDSGKYTVQVALSQSLGVDVTIGLSSTGDAISGSDYVSFNNFVIIAANSTLTSFEISLLADSELEGIELIDLALTTHSGAPSDMTLVNKVDENSLLIEINHDIAPFANQVDLGDANINTLGQHTIDSHLRLGVYVEGGDNAFNSDASADDTTSGNRNIVPEIYGSSITFSSKTTGSNASSLKNGRIDDGDEFATASGQFDFISFDLGSLQSVKGLIINNFSSGIKRVNLVDAYVLMSKTAFDGDASASGFESNFAQADWRLQMDTDLVNLNNIIKINVDSSPDARYILIQHRTSGKTIHINELQAWVDSSVDDEDGLVFKNNLYILATEYSIDVAVQNPTINTANIYAWVDFDRNQQFDNDELISQNIAAETSETVTLEWSNLSDLELGDSFIRLRLSTGELANPFVPAFDGEVEDYPVTIDFEPVNVSVSNNNSGSEFPITAIPFTVNFVRFFDDVDIDTAVTIYYSVSGSADIEDFEPFETMVVFVGSSTQKTLYFTPIDDSIAEGLETIAITITSDTGAIAGFQLDYIDTGVEGILEDNDISRSISIATEFHALEGSLIGYFDITLNGLVDRAITVNYALDGDVSDLDYVALPSSFIVPSSSTLLRVYITPIDDDIAEPVESLIVEISTVFGLPSGVALVIVQQEATIQIVDDDYPTIKVERDFFKISENATTSTSFIFSLDLRFSSDVTVDYTVLGDAINGVDYETISNSIIIPALSKFSKVFITPLADAVLVEGEEFVQVEIVTLSGMAAGITSFISSTQNFDFIAITEILATYISPVDGGDGPSLYGLPTANVVSDLKIGNYLDAESNVANSHNASNDDNTSGVINLALNGTATSSIGNFNDPNIVIDSTIYYFSNNGLFSIEDTDGYPYWQLDLGSAYNLDSIIIQHRVTEKSRFNNTYLLLSATAFTGDSSKSGQIKNYQDADYRVFLTDELVSSTQIEIGLKNIPNMRYVLLQRSEKSNHLFQLQEVLVFGDSNAVIDDEEGVIFPDLTQNVIDYSIDIAVDNPTDKSINVYAWIDFDNDSNLEFTEVSTATQSANTDSVITLNWFGIGTLIIGNSYARVRITSEQLQGGDGPNDNRSKVASSDGEIEDYILPVIASNISGALTSTFTNLSELPGEQRTTRVAFSVDNSVNREVYLVYSLLGSADVGNDYASIANSIIMPIGATTVSIDITILSDDTLEGSETLLVQLNTVIGDLSGITLTFDSSGNSILHTISDMQTEATVAVNISSDIIEGQNDNPVRLSFTRPIGFNVIASAVIQVGGSAELAKDYAALPSTILIPKDSTEFYINFTTIDDPINDEVEGSETLIFSLLSFGSVPLGTTLTIASNTGLVTIIDDDLATAFVEKISDTAEFNAGEANIRLRLDNRVKRDVTVHYSLVGSAQYSIDYNAINLTQLVPAGSFSVVFTVSPVNDAIVEGLEQIIVKLVEVSGAPIQNEVQLVVASPNTIDVDIVDNDNSLTISFIEVANVEEGSSNGEFLVQSSEIIGFELKVNYTVDSNSSAKATDYSLPLFTNFAIDSTSSSVIVQQIDDTESEFDETIRLVLATVSGVPAGISVNLSFVGLTIYLNDNDQDTVFQVDASADITEGSDAIFEISSDHFYDFDLTIEYTFAGSANFGSDYLAVPLTVLYTKNSNSVFIELSNTLDLIAEINETINLEISTILGLDYSVFDTQLHSGSSDTLTLNNADNTVLVHVENMGNKAENSSSNINYSLSLNRISSERISIRYSLIGSASNSDYTVNPATINFFANRSTPINISIDPINDTLIEGDETLIFKISTIITQHSNLIITEGIIDVVTIFDDEEVTLDISITDDTISENGLSAEFNVDLSQSVEIDITLYYSIFGSAKLGIDYQSIGITTLIPANTKRKVIFLTPIDDVAFEELETVAILLETIVSSNNVQGIIASDSATLSISDEDQSMLSISSLALSISEDNDSSVAIESILHRTNPSIKETTVWYTLVGSALRGIDYLSPELNATIPIASTQSYLYITLVQDTLFEKKETLSIVITTITGLKGSSIDTSANSVIFTIVDDDISPPQVYATDGSIVAGTTDVGSEVVIEVFINSILECTETADIDGTFTCNLGENALPDSSIVSVFAIHVEANNLRSLATKISVDVIAPGILSSFANEFALIGQTEPQTTIFVYVDITDPSTLLCQSVSDAQGNFICQFNAGQSNNQILALVAEDDAGNQGIINVVVDAFRPLPAKNVQASATQITGEAPFSHNIQIFLSSSDQLHCETTVPSDINDFLCDYSENPLVDGDEVYVTVVDASLNSSISTTVSIDDSIPNQLNLDNFYGSQLSGTTEPGIQLVATQIQSATSTVEVCNTLSDFTTGAFNCSFEPPIQLPTSIEVTLTDLANNSSTPIAILYTAVPAPSFVIDQVELSQITVSVNSLPNFTVLVIFPDGSTRIATPVNATRDNYRTQNDISQPTGIITIIVIANSLVESEPIVLPYIENLQPSPPQFTIEDRNDGLVKLTGITEIARPNDTITVQVFFPSGSSQTANAQRDTGSFTFTSENLEPSGKVRIRALDSANNIGDFTEIEYIENIQPFIDQIIIEGDEIGRVRIYGVTEANCQILITLPDDSLLISASDDSGMFNEVTSSVQPSGIVEVVVIDPFENVNTLTYTYTEIDPPPLTNSQVQLVSDELGVITISGTAESFNLVTVIFPDASSLTIETDITGIFEIISTPNQDSGDVIVFSTDPAGNDSTPALSLQNIEKIPPGQPFIDVLSSGLSEITINGTAEIGSTIRVTFPNRVVGSVATSAESGIFTIVSGANQPTGILTVVVDDGNNESIPLEFFYRETTAPPIPKNSQFFEIDSFTSGVTGTGEQNSIIRVIWPDGNLSTTRTDSVFGAFEIIAPKPNVSGNIQVINIDEAGNQSEPYLIAEDFTAPVLKSAYYFVSENGSGSSTFIASVDTNKTTLQLFLNNQLLCTTTNDIGVDLSCSANDDVSFNDQLVINLLDQNFNLSQYEITVGDQDGDGKLDVDERSLGQPNPITVSGIEGPDSNADGIIDVAQANVLSLPAKVGDTDLNADSTITIVLDSTDNSYCSQIRNSTIARAEDFLADSAGSQSITGFVADIENWYPYGVVDLNIECLRQSSAIVKLYYHGHNQQARSGSVPGDYSLQILSGDDNSFTRLDQDPSKNVYLIKAPYEEKIADSTGNSDENARDIVLVVELGINDIDALMVQDTTDTMVLSRIYLGLTLLETGNSLIEKGSVQKKVRIGERVNFVIQLTNTSDDILDRVIIRDILPIGFKVETNNVIINSSNDLPGLLNVTVIDNNIMQTDYLTLEVGEIVQVYYQALVTANVTQGVKVNRASANIGARTISNISSVKVEVENDPIFDDSAILGLVFQDLDADGLQSIGENGIQGVRLVTLNGEWIVTDSYGRFHIPGIALGNVNSRNWYSSNWRGQNFLIKLDIDSLPNSWRVVGENPKIIRLTKGKIDTIKFAVKSPDRLYQSGLKPSDRLQSKFVLPDGESNGDESSNVSLTDSLEDFRDESLQDKQEEVDPIQYSYGDTQVFILQETYFRSREYFAKDPVIKKTVENIDKVFNREDRVSVIIRSYWDADESQLDGGVAKVNAIESSRRLGGALIAYLRQNSQLRSEYSYLLDPRGNSEVIFDYLELQENFENFDNDYGWGVFLTQFSTLEEGLTLVQGIENIDNIGIFSSKYAYGLLPYSLFVGPFQNRLSAQNVLRRFAEYRNTFFIEEVKIKESTLIKRKKIIDKVRSRKIQIAVIHQPVTIINLEEDVVEQDQIQDVGFQSDPASKFVTAKKVSFNSNDFFTSENNKWKLSYHGLHNLDLQVGEIVALNYPRVHIVLTTPYNDLFATYKNLILEYFQEQIGDVVGNDLPNILITSTADSDLSQYDSGEKDTLQTIDFNKKLQLDRRINRNLQIGGFFKNPLKELAKELNQAATPTSSISKDATLLDVIEKRGLEYIFEKILKEQASELDNILDERKETRALSE